MDCADVADLCSPERTTLVEIQILMIIAFGLIARLDLQSVLHVGLEVEEDWKLATEDVLDMGHVEADLQDLTIGKANKNLICLLRFDVKVLD